MTTPAPATLSGELLATLGLSTGAGEPYELRLLRPTPGMDQAAELRRQSDEWTKVAREYVELASAGRLDVDVALRATFASDVLFFAATQMATPSVGTGTMLALHGGEVVGVSIYSVQDGRGVISWVTVHPRFLAGAPTPAGEQVRGIGTTMVCETAEEMLRAGATEIRLTPLDDAAATFWRNRGFEPIGGGELGVVDREGVEQLAAACTANPDDPMRTDECCACGTWESMAEFRLPEMRELVSQR